MSESKRDATNDYPVPRKNVLLLSCMDLRVMSELSVFMDRDNLTNRYDHLIVAGAGLGLVLGEDDKTYQPWSDSFFLHLKISLELHHPEDVYIVEHRACGAYKLIHDEFTNSSSEQEDERTLHRAKARKAAKKIKKWCADNPLEDGTHANLRIMTFLMDLRGQIDHLDTFEPDPQQKLKPKGRPKKKR